MVDPNRQSVVVYFFDQDDQVAIYHFNDTVPVGIFGGECQIDFSLLREEIDRLGI